VNFVAPRWTLILTTLAFVLATTAVFGQTTTPTSTQTAEPMKGVNVPKGYILGPEDVVMIQVINQPQFTSNYVIPASGIIQVLAVGEVHAAGMDMEQLKSAVLKGLKTRLTKPEVSVILVIQRMQRLFVLGDVKLPGQYDVKPGWHVSEALSVAGGLQLGVDLPDTSVTIERPALNIKVEMPLEQALSKESAMQWTLAAGDIVRFDQMQMVPVYVTGDVRLPGIVRLRPDNPDPVGAIALAGGVNPDASLTDVKVIRLTGEQQTLDLSLPLVKGIPGPRVKLNRGDTVLITQSQDRFVILGYVVKPGFFPIPSGQTYRLTDALALAMGSETVAGGSVSLMGRLSRVGMVRTVNGKQVAMVFDLVKFFKKGDLSNNPVVLPGDAFYVPESPHVQPAVIFSALSSFGVILNGAANLRIAQKY
jgi:polysaccharide export outer membrane protein